MSRTLGSVVAVEKAARQRANSKTGVLYKLAQRAAVFAGQSRTYTPFEDLSSGGIQLPAEGNQVQERAELLLTRFADALTPALNLAAVKDWANTSARADVVVNGEILLTEVPVSHLLFLEHQLQDVHTFVSALPVLDPAEQWTRNDQTALWDSEPSHTTRSERHEEALVLHPPTKEHPAQVKAIQVERPVGKWKIVKSSGALSAQRKQMLLDHVSQLQDAVKVARERANQQLAEEGDMGVGEAIFGYLFS